VGDLVTSGRSHSQEFAFYLVHNVLLFCIKKILGMWVLSKVDYLAQRNTPSHAQAMTNRLDLDTRPSFGSPLRRVAHAHAPEPVARPTPTGVDTERGLQAEEAPDTHSISPHRGHSALTHSPNNHHPYFWNPTCIVYD
jgi:hypothetical protein